MLRFLQFFKLDFGDAELLRAQFRSFSGHIPLLYGILVSNTAAITFISFDAEQPIKTLVSPLAICAIVFTRAIWWLRQKNPQDMPDAEILGHLKRTCMVAVIMTLAFNAWVIWVFQEADSYARINLTFFLALSQISTVFCLMTVRAAAMLVALVATVSFASYFSWVDGGKFLPQTLVLFCVCTGMVVVTYNFNRSFAELVYSRRALRKRALETEKLSEENRRIAFTDPLTGLPNRRELFARLDRIEGRESLPLNSLAVVFIDLDGFKEINDQHGHNAGDALIREVSERLNAQCPAHGMLARVGGDEFTVVLETTEGMASAQSQALSIALRMLEEIALPMEVDKHLLQISGSIGIAANLEDSGSPRDLLRRADLAMYYAKTQGKGQIALYSDELDTGRLLRLEIEEQIGAGLGRDEFDVAYQPIVDAQTGAIAAAEALLRWPRRPQGPLQPDDFIEIAEATGQIHPLGLFVLKRACREIGPLEDLTLSVNVSPAQFRHPAFKVQVFEILEQTGFPPERLQLEITESYLLANPERAVQTVAAWKAKGISLALDDFGTGFTSIHYLQSYGFSHIKLDKTMIHGLEPDNKAAMLVSGAIMLASALDMEVIAEGIETEAQASILCEAGCHQIQGYLYGKPMPLTEFSSHYRQKENHPAICA